jgi:riboflavin synthase
MFTGLIETMGTVAHLQKLPGGARLQIRVPQFAAQLELGDSVAVNGCCITVVERDEFTFTADLVPESLARTNLGVLAVGSHVNLERAMAVGDRFGGHWVQGHIDGLGQVRSRKHVGTEDLLEITIPFELSRYIVAQGSVTLDGVSMTVVDAGKDRFRVALIPHTRELTTLGKVQPMDVVNVELDVIAKYVEKHVAAFAQRLPRMIREATPQTSADTPRTLVAPSGEPAAMAPAPGSFSATHAQATAQTVKRDRPKVRRSAQAVPARKPAPAAKPKPKAQAQPAKPVKTTTAASKKASVAGTQSKTAKTPAKATRRTAAASRTRSTSASATRAKTASSSKPAARKTGRR